VWVTTCRERRAVSDLDSAIAAIVVSLERELLDVELDGDTLRVDSSDGVFAFVPVVRLAPDLLRDYLQQSNSYPWPVTDPRAEALSLLEIHIVEELTTDHAEGRNHVRSVGLERRPDGRVALVVDKDVPPLPDVPPDPDLEWRAY
jgi:hypothetical protein